MPARPAFLLDADAVIHLHSLQLIEPLCAALRAGQLALHCTRYVWEQELSSLHDVREKLEAAGLEVHVLELSSPGGKMFRRLLKDRGNPGRSSKGELELLAFAANAGFQTTLVAQDEGARKLARTHKVSALELADFLCELVITAMVNEQVVARAVAPWDNLHAGNGRPKGYDGFAPWLKRWRGKRRAEGVPPD